MKKTVQAYKNLQSLDSTSYLILCFFIDGRKWYLFHKGDSEDIFYTIIHSIDVFSHKFNTYKVDFVLNWLKCINYFLSDYFSFRTKLYNKTISQ